ncbi:hypothetical protein [Histidinibacterium lentulum]|uniref:Tetratricopeptide repeat-like domain-containing protein n=1 Tax=Histidinibacterium lentulum TaxID=2480588 RepID=A0A3N2R4C6_9RHOB|nr:hypothetical protein [Histidinibacterium lentulum]ROU02349.1 hypothetical protein EAT49_08355 [Histidinibacterium lentulum]
MSNPDSFIDEVTEEVRRDRLYATLRRWGWVAILLVILVVGGTAWQQVSNAREMQAAQARGDALLAALEVSDPAARAEALAAVEVDGPASAVAGLLTAAAQEEAGETAAAVATLEGVATNMNAQPIYRELAQLKALLLDEGLSPADRASALEPLAQPGAPFRLVALEAQALAQVAAGQTEDALATLSLLVEDAEVSGGLRDRASALIVALGGTPGSGAAGTNESPE